MDEVPRITTGGDSISTDKAQFHTSSTDVSKTKYSLDGVEEGGDDIYSQANPARPGFTKLDQKDMWRMGRVQEFKVRWQLIMLQSVYEECFAHFPINSETTAPSQH